ncbi:uncharacterized protein LOC116347080 isoform X2 [Contarinia nasturtii]|uniref:uncharacterized protein LOC116347080 isoform X2 n=1 Tax=Contarinia nasturtii TaxID=265458 RepID=UPI0012D40F99|nr:uncharacterized protein LOC116347080 isoform X2 [Contarinia nasturtii]
MSFPTDWDVNRYRADYESDEHWQLRKAFIDAHKDKFPECELVCLAQVFTNIEFLGCRYPKKTMERVALLSKDIAAKFRASRSGRLKRTFVGASDAASAKAKGRGSKTQATRSITIPSIESSFRKQESTTNDEPSASTNVNDNNSGKRKRTLDDNSDDDGQMARPSFSLNPSTERTEFAPTCPANNIFQSKPPFKIIKRLPNTGFIIYETLAQNSQQSISIIQMSAAKQGTVYGQAPVTAGKKEAKQQAFDKALERAKKIHYTIKQKSVHTVSVDVDEQNDGGGDAVGMSKNTQLNEDNIGFKMMKMLGWSGGALGVSGNGIEQPISIEMKVDRCGLGLSSDSTKLNYDFFVDYLTKYKTDESATYDLAFSKEFTKDERKTLHEIASRLGLKSRSHNTADGSRYIIIFKKLELIDLANEIFNNGLRSKCYELIAPTEPEPQKATRKILPPHLQQRKANKIGFNYTQQSRNQHHAPKQNNKRKKFF